MQQDVGSAKNCSRNRWCAISTDTNITIVYCYVCIIPAPPRTLKVVSRPYRIRGFANVRSAFGLLGWVMSQYTKSVSEHTLTCKYSQRRVDARVGVAEVRPSEIILRYRKHSNILALKSAHNCSAIGSTNKATPLYVMICIEETHQWGSIELVSKPLGHASQLG